MLKTKKLSWVELLQQLKWLNKKKNDAIIFSMDGPRDCHTEWNKSDTERQNGMVWYIILYEVPGVVRVLGTESTVIVSRGYGERENGELGFNGNGVSVWKTKKFWKWMMMMHANNVDVLKVTELHT